jgi:hypothetical protein
LMKARDQLRCRQFRVRDLDGGRAGSFEFEENNVLSVSLK